jgi:hypothetical protein
MIDFSFEKHKNFLFNQYLVFSEFTSGPTSLLASSRASAFFLMILGLTESFCVFQMKSQSFF